LLDELDGFDFELRRVKWDDTCHRDTSLASPQSSGVHQSGSTPAGSAAVGAATPNSASDSTAASNGLSLNRSHEVRGDVTVAPVTTDRVVVIVPANIVAPTTPVQVFNDDRRN